MTRKLLGMAALLCLVAWQSHAVAWDKGTPTETGETTIASRLQGTWMLVSVEIMGMKIEGAMGQILAFIFDGNKCIVVENMSREEGSYKVDDTKTPKTIDLTPPMGKGMGTIKGIYQLDGDTLKIGISPEGPNGNRPSGFDAKDVGIVVLKRKK
jgi:uncharacterized protein (TIGR03067 family)